jgi:hypothetical protein
MYSCKVVQNRDRINVLYFYNEIFHDRVKIIYLDNHVVINTFLNDVA